MCGRSFPERPAAASSVEDRFSLLDAPALTEPKPLPLGEVARRMPGWRGPLDTLSVTPSACQLSQRESLVCREMILSRIDFISTKVQKFTILSGAAPCQAPRPSEKSL